MPKLTIKAKFSIDEPVWFMKDNKPRNMVVHHLEIVVTEKWNRIEYFFQGPEEVTGTGVRMEMFSFEEDKVYPSKKALLESL